mgnify:CR=1 FL=1
MRITIEPTADQSNYDESLQQHKVILEHPSDELTAVDAVELVANALIAWGYHPDNINELVNRG